ncbi:MAG: bifunctional oligoribonuclease/PAP phosphatase NrnA, partial [Candidatus Melainabacteria bacterium]|nr:bifunctional oligoribonuclease/PAP phosphatase NrnA [Candidatus Melainabacteria bacterium]
KVDFVMSDPVPEIFKFLPYADQIKNPEDKNIQNKHDLSFSLDCGSLKRLGRAGKLFQEAKKSINIDHHISNEKFATINWIEADATSTGQLVYWLAKELNVKISKEIATLLYVTLLTDTGCFANSNTNAEALSWGAELIKLGADSEAVYRKVFLEKPFKTIKIFGIGLKNLAVLENGDIGWTYVTKEEMNSLNATGEDTEDIVDYVMRTRGVKLGVFFREHENEIKVSLRSHTNLDVSEIAMSLGGGGHKRAAGINIKKPFSEVKELILGKVVEAYKKSNGKK